MECEENIRKDQLPEFSEETKNCFYYFFEQIATLGLNHDNLGYLILRHITRRLIKPHENHTEGDEDKFFNNLQKFIRGVHEAPQESREPCYDIILSVIPQPRKQEINNLYNKLYIESDKHNASNCRATSRRISDDPSSFFNHSKNDHSTYLKSQPHTNIKEDDLEALDTIEDDLVFFSRFSAIRLLYDKLAQTKARTKSGRANSFTSKGQIGTTEKARRRQTGSPMHKRKQARFTEKHDMKQTYLLKGSSIVRLINQIAETFDINRDNKCVLALYNNIYFLCFEFIQHHLLLICQKPEPFAQLLKNSWSPRSTLFFSSNQVDQPKYNTLYSNIEAYLGYIKQGGHMALGIPLLIYLMAPSNKLIMTPIYKSLRTKLIEEAFTKKGELKPKVCINLLKWLEHWLKYKKNRTILDAKIPELDKLLNQETTVTPETFEKLFSENNSKELRLE